MASVDFRKCKAGSGDAGALLRHCDTRERLKHGHSNEHIDKALTPLNRQGARSYEQTMAALRDRLAELDARPGANVRKDRVECFILEAPIPAGVRNVEAFADMVVQEISKFSGPQNVLNWYLHRDERHDYVDHGEIKTSLDHVHVAVVPEVDGRLNGKTFSSRERMIDLNKRIDERAREMGGPAFLAGTHPRKRSVEELKIASYKEAAVAEKEARAAQRQAEREREIAHHKTEQAHRDAKDAAERAQNAQEAVKAGKAYLDSLKRQIEPLEGVLERIRASGNLQDRKVHKTLGGKKRIYITPEEARALDAAVAVKTPLIEAEGRAQQVIDAAQCDADRILEAAHRDANGILHSAQDRARDIDETLASVQLRNIQRDHPELFNRLGVYQKNQKRDIKHVEQWLR